MREYHGKHWTKRYTGSRNVARVMRVMIGFVVLTIIMRMRSKTMAEPRMSFKSTAELRVSYKNATEPLISSKNATEPLKSSKNTTELRTSSKNVAEPLKTSTNTTVLRTSSKNATILRKGFKNATLPRMSSKNATVLRTNSKNTTEPKPRRRFDLRNSARCVPLHRGHLENSFVRNGTCFSRRKVQQIITDLVVDSSVIFDAYNLTYFLDSGTLLGSYRSGSVIPHDQDADLGMDVKSIDFLRNNLIAFPSKYELHVHNSTLHPQGTRFDGLPAKVVHKESGLYMDIFEYVDTIKKGSAVKVTGPIPSVCFHSCKSCPRVSQRKWHFQVPYDWIYPLQECQFGGQTLKCPAEPEKYLQYMYGDDFTTPDYDYV